MPGDTECLTRLTHYSCSLEVAYQSGRYEVYNIFRHKANTLLTYYVKNDIVIDI